MTRIALIGTGLIGTSLALALRQAEHYIAPLATPLHITGYDAFPDTLAQAYTRGALDQATTVLGSALSNAELVIIAAPPQAIRAIFVESAPFLPKGVVVTDVASTKAQVCAWAHELLPAHVAFVGGHPMAGREQSGPNAALADLFQGATYCLTPTAQTPDAALNMVGALAQTIGAKPLVISPDEHDRCVAGISHLPFLMATALVHATTSDPLWKTMQHLAATGFRDTTRIASGSTQMYMGICLTNRTAILEWLGTMSGQIETLRSIIEHADSETLAHFLSVSKQARDSWLAANAHLQPKP